MCSCIFPRVPVTIRSIVGTCLQIRICRQLTESCSGRLQKCRNSHRYKLNSCFFILSLTRSFPHRPSPKSTSSFRSKRNSPTTVPTGYSFGEEPSTNIRFSENRAVARRTLLSRESNNWPPRGDPLLKAYRTRASKRYLTCEKSFYSKKV